MGKQADEQQEGPLTAVVLEKGEEPVVALSDDVQHKHHLNSVSASQHSFSFDADAHAYFSSIASLF